MSKIVHDLDLWEERAQGRCDAAGASYYCLLACIDKQQLHEVPKLVAHIIEQEHWKRWRWIGFDFTAPSIESYISAHPPKGLGASVDVIKRVLTDYPKVLRMFEKAVEAEKISTLAVQDPANQQPAEQHIEHDLYAKKDEVYLRQSGSRKEAMLRRSRDAALAINVSRPSISTCPGWRDQHASRHDRCGLPQKA